MVGKEYYSFSNIENKTVGQLLSDKTSIFYNELKPISLVEFLNFHSESGETNKQAIEKMFIGDEERGIGLKLLIKNGVKLVCPKTRSNKTQHYPEGKLKIQYYSDLAFKSSFLLKLEANKKYKSSFTSKNYSVALTKNTLSVWVWCRRMGDSHLDGKLINISPFIQSLETNQGKNGGNFSFKLPPINCVYDTVKKKWVLDRENTLFYQGKTGLNYVSVNHIQNEGKTSYNEGFKVNSLYFHQLLSPNDIVFIKFEKLDIEPERENNISETDLPDQVYDLIGLIDENPVSGSVESGTEISVRGRDLTKLLIEDGTYFYPQEFSQGYYDDLRYSTGSLVQLAKPINRSIEEILNYSISNLSNIIICNDDLLRNFENIGTRNGIWKLIELNIDNNVSTRRVIDSSISTAQGSILTFFKKVCYEPFVEFMADTYGDRFIFSVRTPPFSKVLLQNIVNGFYKNEKNEEVQIENSFLEVGKEIVSDFSFTFSDEIFTWFQIMPKETLGGLVKELSFIAVPPKIFPELVEMYGSKPYQIQHNYLTYNVDLDSENKAASMTIKEQCLEDLKFVIESFIYLPFTRKGTITLIGDRRFKRGNFIHYLPTNEIYHIDNVKQVYAAENNLRKTVLQVSRGMVLDFINGKEVEGYGFVSYFDIVKLEGVNEYVDYKEEVGQSEIIEELVESVSTQVMEQFAKKSTVNIEKINPVLIIYLSSLPENLKKFILITSGNDSKVHVTNSRHYSDNAIDMRFNNELYNYIRNDVNGMRNKLGIRVLDADKDVGTSKHIHIDTVSSVKERNAKKKTQTIVEKPRTNTYRVIDVRKTLDNIKINRKVLQFFIKNLQYGE